MKKVIAFILFVLWLCAVAVGLLAVAKGQSFGSFTHDRPFLAKDAASTIWTPSNNVAGMAYWWVHSDIASNTVDQWPDRIQGAIWTNGETAKRPSNSEYGVRFDGPTTKYYLTNTGFGGASSGGLTIAIILRWTDPDYGFGAYLGHDVDVLHAMYLFGEANAEAQNQGSRWCYTANATKHRLLGIGTNVTSVATNATVLLVGTWHVTDPELYYTNGIQSSSQTTTGNPLPTFNALGRDRTGNWYGRTDIREVMVWTNQISAASASNLYVLYTLTNYGGDVYIP